MAKLIVGLMSSAAIKGYWYVGHEAAEFLLLLVVRFIEIMRLISNSPSFR